MADSILIVKRLLSVYLCLSVIKESGIVKKNIYHCTMYNVQCTVFIYCTIPIIVNCSLYN